MRVLAFLIILALTGPSYSAQNELQCNGIDSLQRPSGRHSFTYKYKYYRGTQADQPTVIKLPGGPGQTSISQDDPRVSNDYGYIQTDPRGTGCNASYWDLDAEALSTSLLAEDIVAIIQQHQLTDFILYGTSFGTALATVVAHQLQSQGLDAPKAIVLEGVMGRSYNPEETNLGYIYEWKKQLEEISPANLALLQSDPLPLEFTDRQWGQWINTVLLLATYPGYAERNLFNSYLSEIDDPINSQDVENSVLMANEEHPNNLINVYQHIGCREFVHGWTTDTFLEDGNLVIKPSVIDFCEDIENTNPFDSNDYPLENTKLIYFIGENDPATPLWQAQHHIDSQTQVNRDVILVHGGGHGTLQLNLFDCDQEIWRAIVDGDSLEDALSSCQLSTEWNQYKAQ